MTGARKNPLALGFKIFYADGHGTNADTIANPSYVQDSRT